VGGGKGGHSPPPLPCNFGTQPYKRLRYSNRAVSYHIVHRVVSNLWQIYEGNEDSESIQQSILYGDVSFLLVFTTYVATWQTTQSSSVPPQ